MRGRKRLAAIALTMVMTVGTVFSGVSANVSAAAKPKLSATKLSITVGSKKTLKVKDTKGVKKTSWTASNSKIKLSSKKKTSVKVQAKKTGSAKITAKVKMAKKVYKLNCKVTIKAKTVASPSVKPSTAPTIEPTAAPTVTPTQTPTPKDPPTNMKGVFGGQIENVGTCINYNGWRFGKQLQTTSTLEATKENFNSITLEDEMKPDSVLGYMATTITVDQAKELGYVIPDNYTETKVPKLNFDTIDKAMQIAYDNGLRMRAHVLMWHQQTRTWFFKYNYSDSYSKVTAEEMDARLEFYVCTVMKHVLEKDKEISGQAGSIVYCWDVLNEYTHRYNAKGDISWTDIYGDMGLEPTYVKKAFECAFDMLKEYGIQDKVTLFSNDYDTYEVADDMVKLIEYINKGETERICRGVGMQTHIDIDYPSPELYGETIQKFADAGLEIQITEFDATINFTKGEPDAKVTQTNEDQADYIKALFTEICKRKLAGANITGFTFWGVTDKYSWRGDGNGNGKPLLFSGDPIQETDGNGNKFWTFTKKPSFYAAVEAMKPLWQ